MRIIVFGTGKVYEQNRKKLLEMNVTAFLDNNPDKRGKYLDGKVIDLPENVSEYAYDYIVIASVYYEEMREQLVKQGINGELIIDAGHRGFWEQIRKIERYDFSQSNTSDPRVLLITHDLSLTGAPLMLYYAAKILRKNGYNVTIYSKADGPLRYDYLKSGISTGIFENFDFDDCEIERYFSGYHMILANTVVLSKLVKQLEKTGTPVMWWLHEEENAYEIYGVKEMPQYGRLHVYCVSERAVSAYEKCAGNRRAEQLVYGIPREVYQRRESHRRSDRKIVYAIIGYVSERKGHDTFISSIKKNWDRWKEQAEFWVIGIITAAQRKEMEETGVVRVFGSLDHRDLIKLYADIDIVVCPSRNDPMPVVLAEAMMNQKVCIASDMTGTAKKITPYENGLICRAGDIDSLAEQIDWALVHRERLDNMGKRAYEVYLQNFSQEQFRDKLLQIVSSIKSEDKMQYKLDL